MKSVKVILSVLALSAVAFVSTSSAQEKGKGGKGGRGGLTIERVEEAVGALTAEQKTKIEAILAKQREATQGLGQDDMEKRREIGTKARADIRAVLTAEQQTKFDALPQGGKGGGQKKKQN